MDKDVTPHCRKRTHLALTWEAGQRGNTEEQLGVRASGWQVTHSNPKMSMWGILQSTVRQRLEPWQDHKDRGVLGIPCKMTSGKMTSGQEVSNMCWKQSCSGRNPKRKGGLGIRDNLKGES